MTEFGNVDEKLSSIPLSVKQRAELNLSAHKIVWTTSGKTRRGLEDNTEHVADEPEWRGDYRASGV
jgi:hypothetical protein